jgi:hypothetical protein
MTQEWKNPTESLNWQFVQIITCTHPVLIALVYNSKNNRYYYAGFDFTTNTVLNPSVLPKGCITRDSVAHCLEQGYEIFPLGNRSKMPPSRATYISEIDGKKRLLLKDKTDTEFKYLKDGWRSPYLAPNVSNATSNPQTLNGWFNYYPIVEPDPDAPMFHDVIDQFTAVPKYQWDNLALKINTSIPIVGYESSLNAGVVASKMVLLDVDSFEEAVKMLATIRIIFLILFKELLPSTHITVTPGSNRHSWGIHIYFFAPEKTGGTSPVNLSKIHIPCVETKHNSNGYVVAPGSIREHGEYVTMRRSNPQYNEIMRHFPINDLPSDGSVPTAHLTADHILCFYAIGINAQKFMKRINKPVKYWEECQFDLLVQEVVGLYTQLKANPSLIINTTAEQSKPNRITPRVACKEVEQTITNVNYGSIYEQSLDKSLPVRNSFMCSLIGKFCQLFCFEYKKIPNRETTLASLRQYATEHNMRHYSDNEIANVFDYVMRNDVKHHSIRAESDNITLYGSVWKRAIQYVEEHRDNVARKISNPTKQKAHSKAIKENSKTTAFSNKELEAGLRRQMKYDEIRKSYRQDIGTNPEEYKRQMNAVLLVCLCSIILYDADQNKECDLDITEFKRYVFMLFGLDRQYTRRDSVQIAHNYRRIFSLLLGIPCRKIKIDRRRVGDEIHYFLRGVSIRVLTEIEQTDLDDAIKQFQNGAVSIDYLLQRKAQSILTPQKTKSKKRLSAKPAVMYNGFHRLYYVLCGCDVNEGLRNYINTNPPPSSTA